MTQKTGLLLSKFLLKHYSLVGIRVRSGMRLTLKVVIKTRIEFSILSFRVFSEVKRCPTLKMLFVKASRPKTTKIRVKAQKIMTKIDLNRSQQTTSNRELTKSWST